MPEAAGLSGSAVETREDMRRAADEILRLGASVAAPVVRNDAKAGIDERRQLMAPQAARAGARMQEDERRARAAGVLDPQPGAADVRDHGAQFSAGAVS